MNLRERFGRTLHRAVPSSVKYEWLAEKNSQNPDRQGGIDGAVWDELNRQERETQAKHKAEYPWLFDPKRGVRWDFDPVLLRNLSQEQVWVGMMVMSITKELAGMEWAIVESNGAQETQRRLQRSPFERSQLRRATSPAADDLRELIARPNPDDTYDDWLRKSVADSLEVGSMTTVKKFDETHFEGDELTADPRTIRPIELKPSPPEIWTKEFDRISSNIDAFWAFDRIKRPGTGDGDSRGRSRGQTTDPVRYGRHEVAWLDHGPRTNRRYGLPPTLLVKDTLKLMDLTILQEQEYFSKGSLPSGMIVGDEWNRKDAEEFYEEMVENVAGDPHKLMTAWGMGGNVEFKPFSYNYQELQFMERMKWYARIISSAFQVPTAVVGIEPEQINYATFEGERENFESNTLGPYAQAWERFVNEKIIRPHWEGLRFEVQPAVSETSRGIVSERVRAEFDSGLIRRNEARRSLGYDEVDDDEDGFSDDVTESADAAEGLAFERSDDPLREAGGMAQAFTVQPRDIEALQGEIEGPIAEVFDRLLDDPDIMATIEALASDDDGMARSLTDLTRQIEALLRDVDVTDAMIAAVSAARGDMAEAALGRAISQTGEDIDTSQIAERVQARDIDFANSFAQRMSEDIRETVADGWSDGQSSFEIGQELEEKADEFTGWEAERIARQELQQAAGEARSDFAAEVGKVEVWITAGDNRVREAHQAMDRTYKLPGEKWEVDYTDMNRGVKEENQPGDSEPGIGCRCDVLLVDFDELEDYGVDPSDDHRGV